MELIEQFSKKSSIHLSEYSDLIHKNLKEDVGPLKMLFLTLLLKLLLLFAKLSTYVTVLIHYSYLILLFLTPTFVSLAQTIFSHPFINDIISYIMSISLLIFSSFLDMILLKKKFDLLEKKHFLLEESHKSLQNRHDHLENKVGELTKETEKLKEDVKEIQEKHDLVSTSERRLTMEHTVLQEKHETLRNDFEDFKKFVITQLKK